MSGFGIASTAPMVGARLPVGFYFSIRPPDSACGSGPGQPSLARTERSEWATADWVCRWPGLRTGFAMSEQRNIKKMRIARAPEAVFTA